MHQPSGQYPALTALRGLAALWVLLYHAWVAAGPRWMGLRLGSFELNLTPVFSLGWVGVDVFFTLSAFLLTLPFAVASVQGRDRPPVGRYLARRMRRILPAYYVQLLLVLAFVRITEQRWAIDGPGLWAHATLWLNIGSEPVRPLVGVWWTLPIEFGYYLLLPLLLPWLRGRRALLLLLLAVAATFGYRWGMFQHAQALAIGEKVLLLEQLPGRLDQFVLGSVAAVWVANSPQQGRQLSAARARVWLAAGAAGAIALLLLMTRHHATYWDGHVLLYCFHFCMGVAMTLMIIGLCSERLPEHAWLSSRPLLLVGTISYSLYLWHQMILLALAEQPWMSAPTPYLLPALLLVGGTASLLVAWLSWRLVERPFLEGGPVKSG